MLISYHITFNFLDIVNGSVELKQAWKILDNTKNDNKTRLKTMTFIKDYYDKRIQLFQLPYIVKKMKE